MFCLIVSFSRKIAYEYICTAPLPIPNLIISHLGGKKERGKNVESKTKIYYKILINLRVNTFQVNYFFLIEFMSIFYNGSGLP